MSSANAFKFDWSHTSSFGKELMHFLSMVKSLVRYEDRNLPSWHHIHWSITGNTVESLDQLSVRKVKGLKVLKSEFKEQK